MITKLQKFSTTKFGAIQYLITNVAVTIPLVTGRIENHNHL